MGLTGRTGWTGRFVAWPLSGRSKFGRVGKGIENINSYYNSSLLEKLVGHYVVPVFLGTLVPLVSDQAVWHH